ncbi:glycosyltransferase [Listeria valentina]|uniref:glycosyltransferase n=1 Tax=Listeria valentina TaxID=2705293 RepID=UPI0014315F50|nr:glycosyltransferase family 2 protein [Listeria valentina]
MISDVFGPNGFNSVLSICVFILCLYPVLGSFFWFVGSISYHFLKRFKYDEGWEQLPMEKQPFITIMVPAHNEEIMIEHTITYLFEELNYQNYEVIVIDDGSKDSTPVILQNLQEKYEKLRVIRVEANQGKAHAFNLGLGFAKGEYILSNDADTIPEKNALMKYMHFFLDPDSINTAAVTANMDVQNRTKIIGKSQTVEFSSIVGVIKRSQAAINNAMYSYSGANTLYRKKALIDVGLFRQNRATEDISIAWDHQLNGWTPRFAPNILFYMNVPETLTDLYHQRKRWAKGGTEVWLTNFKKVCLHPVKRFHSFIMYIDQTLSIIWSFFFWITSFIFVAHMLYHGIMGETERIYHGFYMSFIFVTFEMFAGILQLLAALILDNRRAKFKYLIFAPFYMLFYWMINPITIVLTFFPAVKTIMGKGTGTWHSPTRIKMK